MHSAYMIMSGHGVWSGVEFTERCRWCTCHQYYYSTFFIIIGIGIEVFVFLLLKYVCAYIGLQSIRRVSEYQYVEYVLCTRLCTGMHNAQQVTSDIDREYQYYRNLNHLSSISYSYSYIYMIRSFWVNPTSHTHAPHIHTYTHTYIHTYVHTYTQNTPRNCEWIYGCPSKYRAVNPRSKQVLPVQDVLYIYIYMCVCVCVS